MSRSLRLGEEMRAQPLPREGLETVLRMQNERIEKVFWISSVVGQLNITSFICGLLILVFAIYMLNIRLATYFATLGSTNVLYSPNSLFWLDILVSTIPANAILLYLWRLVPNWGYWLMRIYCELWSPDSYTLDDLRLYQSFRSLGPSALRQP